ncbi:MAG: TetR/AcrR family transcriptional regulator [Sphaerochaetaceae bacterium]
MAKAEYRSSIRSKNLIKAAAIELLAIKNWNKITVTDIVNKADINRGTFYAHYSNPIAIYKAIEEDIINTILEAITANSILDFLRHPEDLMEQLTDYVASNDRIVKILFSSEISSQLVLGHKKRLGDYLIEETAKIPSIQNRGKFNLVLRMLITCIVDSYIAMLSGEMGPVTREEFRNTAAWLVRGMLKPYLPPEST